MVRSVSAFSPLRSKAVLDANRETIGTVIGSEMSKKTGEPQELLVALDPGLHERVGAERRTIWLPARRVRSIRRDELALDETIDQLLQHAEREARGGPPATGSSDDLFQVHRTPSFPPAPMDEQSGG